MFKLHPRLAEDTMFVVDWALSRVLLMNDARFPWVILVPRRENLRELHDLTSTESDLLIGELVRAGRNLKSIARAAKINTGALGNLVSQLHIHVVARRSGDAAWPGPVWGCGAAVSYDATSCGAFIHLLRSAL